jgi:SAM-dependent methyltransferase
MLNIARQKIKSRRLDIPLYRFDFRRLPKKFKGQFDAVFCLTTSLPQLSDIRQATKALASIKSVIKKNGILVISQGMTDKQYKLKPRFIPISYESDISRIMVIDYGDNNWQAHIIDLRHGGNNLNIKVFAFDYLKLLKKDYQGLLRKTGFKEIRFYGNYALEKYQIAKSDRLIIIARK